MPMKKKENPRIPHTAYSVDLTNTRLRTFWPAAMKLTGIRTPNKTQPFWHLRVLG